jgi:hypothetical protein
LSYYGSYSNGTTQFIDNVPALQTAGGIDEWTAQSTPGTGATAAAMTDPGGSSTRMPGRESGSKDRYSCNRAGNKPCKFSVSEQKTAQFIIFYFYFLFYFILFLFYLFCFNAGLGII